jgi:hypothetical protein
LTMPKPLHPLLLQQFQCHGKAHTDHSLLLTRLGPLTAAAVRHPAQTATP